MGYFPALVPILNIFVKYWNVYEKVIIKLSSSVGTERVAGRKMRGKFFESGRIVNAKTNPAALVCSDEPRPLKSVHAGYGRGKCDPEWL